MLYFYNNHGKQVGTNCPIQFGLEQTNCIIYCSSVIEWAYAQVGKKEIAKTIVRKSKKGTDLAKYLHSIGWKGIYWNPDVKNPFDSDNEHSYSYTIAKNKKRYYGIPVIGYVINYRPTDFYKNDPPWWKVWESRELDISKITKTDLSGFAKLKRVRFGFGAARGGKHTFLYGSGSIYEVHWGGISILGLYEKSPFLDYGWLSGILMIPPGNGVY